MSRLFRLKTLLTLSLCWFVCFNAAANVQAQETLEQQRAREQTQREEAERRAAERSFQKEIDNAKRGMANPKLPQKVYSKSYDERDLTPEQKRILAASPEDQIRFTDVLKQANTGIIRLLPQGKLEASYTVSADDPQSALPIKGGGAYYSFAKKTHVFGLWSDICLRENVLHTGITELSFGLFTVLGDVPIESVTLQNPVVNSLHRIAPPTSVPEALVLRKRNAAGLTSGNITYGSAFQVRPNVTYILRSISFQQPDYLYRFNSLKEGLETRTARGSNVGLIPSISPPVYRGADVLIAFRVVRQDGDQGVTILWKRLHKASAPELKTEQQ
jgi:hypothetical protein